MDEEVNEYNIYSRLVALEKMEIVKDYKIIRQKSVAIIGVGGIGSVVAEMLTRCGIGKLILFDYDKVELSNMNRLFFTPEQAKRKLFKTDAARETLTSINPDVNIATYCYDITTSANFEKLLNTLKTEGDPKQKNPVQQQVDLLLCCVDNHAARMSINLACLELELAWIESGVSETAMSGHIQFIQPGISPCFECAPPLLIAEGLDEKSIKRKYACAASLPTTMAIIAGLMGNNVLEYLLNFGQIVDYCGYNVLSSHFVKQDMKVSLDCPNSKCQARQAEWRAFLEKQKAIAGGSSGGGGGNSKEAKEVEEQKKEKEADAVKWKKMGIVLEDESDNTNEEEASCLEQGLRYQFAKETIGKGKEGDGAATPTPASSVLTSTSSSSSSTSSSSFADLLSQLKGLHGNK